MPTYRFTDNSQSPSKRSQRRPNRPQTYQPARGEGNAPKKSNLSVKRILLYTLIGFVIVNFLGFLFFNESYTKFTSSLTYEAKQFQINYKTYNVTISDALPEQYRAELMDSLDDVEYKGKKRYQFVEKDADISVGYGIIDDESYILKSEALLPVVHLYSFRDGITEQELLQGEVDIVTLSSYEKLVGTIFPDIDIHVVERVSDINWQDQTIALLLLSDLTPEQKLLAYEGKYFLDDPDSGYVPASIGVTYISADSSVGATLIALARTESKKGDLITNDQILKLNMTGVTALSRNLAFKIDASGDPAYAAGKIKDFLADADLTHTSNEVSFIDDCAPVRSMSFCSNTKYLAALDAIGLDIIELTGNHNNDYGAIHNTNSIAMYKERGWDYFGGGLDSNDAAQILYKEIDGTKLAFIGYNYYDTILGSGALAGSSRAGANSYSDAKMKADIEAAKSNGAVVIVDFQFQECYSYPESDVIFPPCYKPLSSPDQVGVFRLAADYGADIVVGTQAHQPQTFEVYKDKTIFYGLGNIFFDQILWIGTRQGLVLTHYFVEGRHVQTKITTTIYDADMRPYVTEGEDRQLLLELLDNARKSSL